MKLSKVEFKKLLMSNLSERVYQRCRTCDRPVVEAELTYLKTHGNAKLPVKGLSYSETIKAIEKGIAAHDSFKQNIAHERSCAKALTQLNLNQLQAF